MRSNQSQAVFIFPFILWLFRTKSAFIMCFWFTFFDSCSKTEVLQCRIQSQCQESEEFRIDEKSFVVYAEWGESRPPTPSSSHKQALFREWGYEFLIICVNSTKKVHTLTLTTRTIINIPTKTLGLWYQASRQIILLFPLKFA